MRRGWGRRREKEGGGKERLKKMQNDYEEGAEVVKSQLNRGD